MRWARGAGSDRILDFQSETDKVHLSGLGAGQMRYSVTAGIGTLAGDLDGDSTADFALLFTNGTALVSTDLTL